MILALVAVVQRNDAEQQASRAEVQADVADEQAALAEAEAGRAEDAADLAAAESERARDAEADAEVARGAESDARTLSDARLLAARAPEVFDQDQDAGTLLAVAASDLLDSSGQETPEVMRALFDTATRHRTLHRFRLPREPFGRFGAAPLPNVSSDPEGSRLAVLVPSPDGDGIEAQVVDLHTGALQVRLDAVANPTSVLWDPSSDEILVGSDGGLSSVDPESGRREDIVEGSPGRVFVLAADADTITYVREDGDDERGQIDSTTSVIVDRSNGETLAAYPGTYWVARSPSRDSIVLSPRGQLDTDVATLETFQGRDPIPTTASNNVFGWTPNGDIVVEHEGLLQRLRPDGTVVRETPTETPLVAGLASAALSPDGRWIAIEGAAGRVYIRDAQTLDLVDGLTLDDGGTALLGIAWAGDSRHLITVDTTDQAVVWDLTESARGDSVAMTGSTSRPNFTSGPTDTELWLGWADASWEVWNTETGMLERRAAGSHFLTSVTLRSDLGVVAASAGGGQGVAIEDLRTGARSIVATGEFDAPLALSPDGSQLAVTHLPSSLIDRSITTGMPGYGLYDVASGELILRRDNPDRNHFFATFSPEGDVLLVPTWNPHGESGDAGGVAVFDTATGTEITSIAVDGGAFSVTYSPDARMIAIGGGRGGVELHGVEELLSGRDSLIGRAEVPRSALMVPSFDDEGSTIVAGEATGATVTTWSADATMDELWSVELDGWSAATTIRDGLLWVIADGALPIDPHDGATGLIGVPADRAELADFARDKLTRGFTEGECQTFLASTCEEFEARLRN
jgi:WD40 repeat protein